MSIPCPSLHHHQQTLLNNTSIKKDDFPLPKNRPPHHRPHPHPNKPLLLILHRKDHRQRPPYVHTSIPSTYNTPPLTATKTGIVKLTHRLSPTHPQSHICIKIPSTWEGLKACQVLEQAGVRTLATTLFTMPQAILAAEVGCTYIAPYVNQLRVHFEPG